jgi:hypothetical protein
MAKKKGNKPSPSAASPRKAQPEGKPRNPESVAAGASAAREAAHGGAGADAAAARIAAAEAAAMAAPAEPSPKDSKGVAKVAVEKVTATGPVGIVPKPAPKPADDAPAPAKASADKKPAEKKSAKKSQPTPDAAVESAKPAAEKKPAKKNADRVAAEPLLSIDGLKMYFHLREGVVKAVDNITISIKRGETLGIVGESGSGKSMTDDSDSFERAPMLTMGERDNIAAIERNVSKYAYEVGIRWMYITQKGKFDGDVISPMIRSFSQYDVIGRNGVGVRWRTDFDYNFLSDRSGKLKLKLKRSELAFYKARYYYYRDRKGGGDAPKVFSVEELATMYHVPGSGVMTPSLPRITSARKEAPSNLPTGISPFSK